MMEQDPHPSPGNSCEKPGGGQISYCNLRFVGCTHQYEDKDEYIFKKE